MLYATCANVDLAAFRANLRAIRERVGSRQIMVALKANAYGHGAKKLGSLVEEEKLADYLAVATTPEALELRAAGIRLPILRLSPAFDEELPALIDADVQLTVQDSSSLATIAALSPRHKVHLAIDTGMHRIGCRPADAREVAHQIVTCGLSLEGIFTHLPVADSVEGKEFTNHQLQVFLNTVRTIQDERAANGMAPVPLIHAANSGAILGHDLSGFTLVRPGILVYGYYPDNNWEKTVPVSPILELTSRVSTIHKINAGETVGYSRTWTAPTDRWIATVPIGYADGYSRSLSNRGRMLINGVSYPIAGRVCMDQTMVDLGSASDRPPASIGDEVCLIGRQGDEKITADEIASLMGTISYEVTCLINSRVPRLYHE